MKKIKLKAIDNFKCLGGQCPQNCCTQFFVNVDAKTRKAWRQLSMPGNNEVKLTASIKQVKVDGRVIDKLDLDENKRCILLDENNLCSVQKQYGHDVLPSICREFPRFLQKDKNLQISSAALSCPEIVRLVLTAKQDQLFDYSGDDLFKLKKIGSPSAYRLIKETLADFLTLLIKQRDFGLNIKLFYLAFMVTRFLNIMGTNGVSRDSAKEFLDVALENLNDQAIQIANGEISVNPETAGSYWKMIYHWSGKRNVNFSWLDGFDSELLQLLKLEDSGKQHFSSIYAKLKVLQTKVLKTNAKQLSALFDRYFIASLINKGFPLQPYAKHYLATLVYIYTVIALVQLYIWLYYEVHGEISQQAIVNIIYHVEHQAGQTDEVYKHLGTDGRMLALDQYANVFLDVFA